MLDKIRNEPAVVSGLVVAILTLVVAFGVPISADQKTAIVGVVAAVLTLLGAGVTRSQVSPVAKRDAAGRFTKENGATALVAIGLTFSALSILVVTACAIVSGQMALLLFDVAIVASLFGCLPRDLRDLRQ